MPVYRRFTLTGEGIALEENLSQDADLESLLTGLDEELKELGKDIDKALAEFDKDLETFFKDFRDQEIDIKGLLDNPLPPTKDSGG